MKKLLIVSAAWLLLCAGTFYAGFRYGEFNGRIEGAAMDTSPLMNLLLTQAGKETELIEMNRSQLYFHLDLYDALRASRLVSRSNKEILRDRILIAKEYWEATGGHFLQTEEAAKEMRQTVEEIQAAAGIPVTMSINGEKVSPFLFEDKERRIAAIFQKYSGQNSRLHDFIVGMVEEGKKRPNKAPEPTTFAVTSRAIVGFTEGRAWTVQPFAARAAPAKVVAHL